MTSQFPTGKMIGGKKKRRGPIGTGRNAAYWLLRVCWLVRRPTYWLSLSEDVRNELVAGIIIFTYAIVGILAWLLGNAYSDAQADRAVLTGAKISQYNQAQEVQVAFAEGIPQNLFYLTGIRNKVLWMDSMGTAAGAREPYFDGRTFKEISISLEDDQRLWLKECHHYVALCERVRGRFGGPVGACADLIRYTFDRLNDVDLDRQNLSSISSALRARLLDLPAQLKDRSDVPSADGRHAQMVELNSHDLKTLADRYDRFTINLGQRGQAPVGRTFPAADAAPFSSQAANELDSNKSNSTTLSTTAPASGAGQVDQTPDRGGIVKGTGAALTDAQELVALMTETVDILYTATVRAISEELRSPPAFGK